MGNCRGVRAKVPFSFLSPATKTVEGGEGGAGDRFPSPISEEGTRREGCDGPGHGGRAAARGSASRGSQGRVLVGKREREGPGTYLGPWLEQGGGGAGRPWEAGAAAEQACGSGAAA